MFLLDDHLMQLAKDGKISVETAMMHSQQPRTLKDKLAAVGVGGAT